MSKHTHTAPRTSDGGARAQACAQTEFKVADWTTSDRSFTASRPPSTVRRFHAPHTHPTHYVHSAQLAWSTSQPSPARRWTLASPNQGRSRHRQFRSSQIGPGPSAPATTFRPIHLTLQR
ncbi:hypothetical protein CPAR01_03749 [Colletotrichum paranaense]|uniref:Uncharacterized protein n=2 Tax=Colletotrichum acutatum species complex TaxID=2707335 RepID=A0ABQ9Q9E9_9PEZI|nr:uncharacterized protein CPAR01_03749 [Colletotrichum paranaense]KAI3546033.1 hypothetical protein CSPX01_04529 [Colletotrichum filicis]KAK0380318.1 hypothetical protein CLIM01_02309 [Colletotrichum limetticola]KAK1543116.1 hypothetical protein CPAR01_03749 [Colletotrichum paranaense]